jgi:hypothetical protein
VFEPLLLLLPQLFFFQAAEVRLLKFEERGQLIGVHSFHLLPNGNEYACSLRITSEAVKSFGQGRPRTVVILPQAHAPSQAIGVPVKLGLVKQAHDAL